MNLKKLNFKWLVVFISVFITVLLILLFVLKAGFDKATWDAISNFEECEAAGFPVRESFPPICTIPDGKAFTQYTGNEMEYKDEIVVQNPRPNSIIKSPLTISGKARGNWFFEANFTAELVDENDKVIGTAILTAQGEWMTEDFVPFTGELSFREPISQKGKLKLKNANASGLPENDKELIIPVRF